MWGRVTWEAQEYLHRLLSTQHGSTGTVHLSPSATGSVRPEPCEGDAGVLGGELEIGGSRYEGAATGQLQLPLRAIMKGVCMWPVTISLGQ